MAMLTRDEAAERLRTTPQWLRRHTADGPPYRRVGRQCLYDKRHNM